MFCKTYKYSTYGYYPHYKKEESKKNDAEFTIGCNLVKNKKNITIAFNKKLDHKIIHQIID